MTKQAKLESQARLPELAMPAATPTRFDSAMPTSKNRSGYFSAKYSVRVELPTSPSRTTISGWSPPSLARAVPKASRVALPSLRSMRLPLTPDPSPRWGEGRSSHRGDHFQGLPGFLRLQRDPVVIRVVDHVCDRVALG